MNTDSGLIIRGFTKEDIPQMIAIWNDIVEDGVAFPQLELLDEESGYELFASQSFTGVAVRAITEATKNFTSDNLLTCNEPAPEILGLYILHPNNIGRCGHICNASYAVKKNLRGMHIGEHLVTHCMKKGAELGFRILQFNAVVRTNISARHLYEKLGFTPLGVIPGGFLMKDSHYEDIVPYYHEL